MGPAVHRTGPKPHPQLDWSFAYPHCEWIVLDRVAVLRPWAIIGNLERAKLPHGLVLCQTVPSLPQPVGVMRGWACACRREHGKVCLGSIKRLAQSRWQPAPTPAEMRRPRATRSRVGGGSDVWLLRSHQVRPSKFLLSTQSRVPSCSSPKHGRHSVLARVRVDQPTTSVVWPKMGS